MKVRTLLVEFREGTDEVTVMSSSGICTVSPDAAALVATVRAQDYRYAARNPEGRTTIIEWRNIPDGFVPPA